jgi:hypothetical protein
MAFFVTGVPSPADALSSTELFSAQALFDEHNHLEWNTGKHSIDMAAMERITLIVLLGETVSCALFIESAASGEQLSSAGLREPLRLAFRRRVDDENRSHRLTIIQNSREPKFGSSNSAVYKKKQKPSGVANFCRIGR